MQRSILQDKYFVFYVDNRDTIHTSFIILCPVGARRHQFKTSHDLCTRSLIHFRKRGISPVRKMGGRARLRLFRGKVSQMFGEKTGIPATVQPHQRNVMYMTSLINKKINEAMNIGWIARCKQKSHSAADPILPDQITSTAD